MVQEQFTVDVDIVVDGKVGGVAEASAIRDARTRIQIR
jgi:hypothetical protein